MGSVFLLYRIFPITPMVQTAPLIAGAGRLAPPFPATRRPQPQCARHIELRKYVMLPVALEHERLLIAERLLTEIERRHGLPHPTQREIPHIIIDRFLAAYLPEAVEGEPAPLALEYAFAPSLTDALHLLRDVVRESSDGRGAAIYVHDLDTGVTADTRELH